MSFYFLLFIICHKWTKSVQMQLLNLSDLLLPVVVFVFLRFLSISNLHLRFRKIFRERVCSPPSLPASGWPLFTQAVPSFPAHHAELLLEMGLCYTAPGGLAAGAGGRHEQAPPARDGSSALAESARERPELGMTPVSKVPHGFIRRPELRFPSPLNFPALLFFWTCFSN